MNNSSFPSIGPYLGTWFDDQNNKYRVYLPFGKTRLNAMGLFYFRNHHWPEIRTLITSIRLERQELRGWFVLDGKRKFLVERIEKTARHIECG